MIGIPTGVQLTDGLYGNHKEKDWPNYTNPYRDSRWTIDSNDSNDSNDSDEDTDSPDPTHECVNCSTGSHIKSETRRNAPHYCDDCESVTRHRRVSS
jgi:hypothetical protein